MKCPAVRDAAAFDGQRTPALLDQPTIPIGYTSFPEILTVLVIQRDGWGLKSHRLMADFAAYPIWGADVRERLNALKEWTEGEHSKQAISLYLAGLLASDRLHAVGISELTGALEWIPSAAWRLNITGELSSCPALPAISQAFAGRRIEVPGPRAC